MKKVRLISSVCIALVFTLFAVVQWNDPDPLRWMIAYMLVACLAVYCIFRPLRSMYTIPLVLCYVVLAIYLWPSEYYGVTMPMSYKKEVELARESMGLMLAALSTALLYFISYKSRTYSRLSRTR